MKRLVFATLVFAQAALAQHYDVIVTDRYAKVADLIAGGQTTTVAGIAVAAPGPDGRVFAAVDSNPAQMVELLHPATARLTIGELPQDWAVDAMVADRAANLHILATRKPYGVALFTMDAHGVVRAQHQMTSLFYGAAAPGVIDLAADQCTLFVSGRDAIHRFDVCEGTFLSDFVTKSGNASREIRILPDGGVLDRSVYGMHRYDANGNPVGSFRIRSSVVPMASMLTRGGTRIMIAGEPCNPDEDLDCPSDLPRRQREVVEVDVGEAPGPRTTNEIALGKLTVAEPNSIVPLFAWTAALGNTRVTRRRAAGF